VNENSTSTLSVGCLESKTDLMANYSLHIESAATMNEIFSGSGFSSIILVMIFPDITQIYIVSRFNSTVLTFHDFSKSTNCGGFNFTLLEIQFEFRALVFTTVSQLYIVSVVSKCIR
jgi:hypothetical protein